MIDTSNRQQLLRFVLKGREKTAKRLSLASTTLGALEVKQDTLREVLRRKCCKLAFTTEVSHPKTKKSVSIPMEQLNGWRTTT